MKKLSPEVQEKVDLVVTDREYFNRGWVFLNTVFGYNLEHIIDLFVADDRLWVLHAHQESPKDYCVSDYLTGLLIPRSRCRSKQGAIAIAKEQIKIYNHTVDWGSQKQVNSL